MPLRPYASPLSGEGDGPPFIWAHRGASALAPENTIKAFLLAAELGANGIELDVQLSADGVPLILHDPFVWSVGDVLALRQQAPGESGSRRLWVAGTDWVELHGVPVRHGDGSVEPIPRLEEVLEAVPEWLWLDIELKAAAQYDPRLVEVVLACLRRRPARVLVSSFDHVVLREVARLQPELPLLAILHARPVDLVGALATIPTKITCIDRPFLTRDDAIRWREDGLRLFVGGAELVDDLGEVLSWPVSGVFLDDPSPGVVRRPRPGRAGDPSAAAGDPSARQRGTRGTRQP
ncbi:MAG: glycerophosphodiester phosphodiesterase [Acidimicrobiales bacterium]